jgi:hypothetical protein
MRPRSKEAGAGSVLYAHTGILTIDLSQCTLLYKVL